MTAFAFLLIGGVEALIIRIQLSRPEMAILSPEAYNQIFTMHGATMIFWYAAPILSGFAVPLMIGARDMAFPRLNAFAYWSYLFSGIFLYFAPLIAQAPHAGWFAYVPYTLTLYSPGLGMVSVGPLPSSIANSKAHCGTSGSKRAEGCSAS